MPSTPRRRQRVAGGDDRELPTRAGMTNPHRYLEAVSEDLTPEQRRAIRRAEAVVADPQTQARIREGQRALASNPQIRQMSQGLIEAIVPTLRTISTAVSKWISQIDWEGIRAALRVAGEAVARLLPPNARLLGTDYWPSLLSLAKDEQLCLSWVPDVELARALADAPDAHEREALLIASSDEVLAACERAVRAAADGDVAKSGDELFEEATEASEQLAEVAELLIESIASAKAGYSHAAQALATCVIDTLIEQHINQRRGRTHTFLKQRLSQAEEAQLLGIVIGPTLAAAESSFRQSGMWPARAASAQPGRSSYSRHATVHAACADSFTDAAALKAVLLATSVFLLSINPILFAILDMLDTKLQVENVQSAKNRKH